MWGGAGQRGKRGRDGGGAGESGEETGRLPRRPSGVQRDGPRTPPSRPGEALTGFTGVLVVDRIRFILFVPIQRVIVVEARADPQLPVQNNPRGRQPHEHPRGKRFQPHPPPLEEKEGTGPGGEASAVRAEVRREGTRCSSPCREAPRRPWGVQVSEDMRMPSGQQAGRELPVTPSCREKLARGPRVGGGQVRSWAPAGGEGRLRAHSAPAERALAACRAVPLAAELPAAAAGRAAPRGLSCQPSSGSSAAPPPLPGPGGRARAAAACARRRRRRSGKMNPVCTSAHLN